MRIGRGLGIVGIAGLAMVATYHGASILGTSTPQAAHTAPPTRAYEIVREYPHDAGAVTQGLIYRDGHFYESTGPRGRASLRKVRLETGEMVQSRPLERYFAEGLTDWNDTLVQLTPMRSMPAVRSTLSQIRDVPYFMTAIGRRLGGNTGIVYDLASLEPQSTFSYAGEGWGLARDHQHLILSDGTSYLRFLDPDRFQEVGRVQVLDRGEPIIHLNELEVVKGEIYANILFEHRIAIIHPGTGQITGWIDLEGLESRLTPHPDVSAGAVLNGIAYDAAGDRLFVTGKHWPRVFEIRLRPSP